MFNFVCNLHSSHVHIAGAGGDKMAAIFHTALKRLEKKRRAQTEVMKDTERTRKLTPRPKFS
jgi:tRNA A22 N-methylase